MTTKMENEILLMDKWEELDGSISVDVYNLDGHEIGVITYSPALQQHVWEQDCRSQITKLEMRGIIHKIEELDKVEVEG